MDCTECGEELVIIRKDQSGKDMTICNDCFYVSLILALREER